MSSFLVPGGGGPKEAACVTKEMRRLLGKPVSAKDRRTWRQMMALVWVKKAASGDFRFFKEMLDRDEGKVPDRLAGAEGGPVGMELIMQALVKIYPEDEVAQVQARLVDDDDEPAALEAEATDEPEEE